MVAMKRERDILLLKLKALTTPSQIPADSLILPMKELLSIIEKVYLDGKHYAIFSANGAMPSPNHMNIKTLPEIAGEPITKNIIFISDFWKSPDETEYRLLIKRGNPDISSPSFTNIEKNVSRSVDPEEGETNGQSSHIVISLKDKHKSVEGYRATLEQISGISRSLVLPYLNGLIDEETKNDPRFSYVKKDKETARYRPAIKHLTNPSASLKADLERGYLSSIEFIDRKVEGEDGPDDEAAIKNISRRLQYHFKPVNNSERAENIIRKFTKRAKERNYDYVRVSMRDSEKEKYVSTRFNTEEEDALDKLYSRAETISNFEGDLKSCYDSIHTNLCDAMMELINTNTKW